jgi:hypothetical protein
MPIEGVEKLARRGSRRIFARGQGGIEFSPEGPSKLCCQVVVVTLVACQKMGTTEVVTTNLEKQGPTSVES